MIEVRNLTMRYGPVLALDRIAFDAAKGQVVGLLGPNGAGKSTTLKILTTSLVPTSGRASVGGFSVVDDALAVRRLIGYLPEALPLYPDMEVGEYLRFAAAARGLSRSRLASRLDWAVGKCGLRTMFRRPIRTLSKGYRQRTALAQAIVHDPAVVILDEPTSGLDPHQILEIRALARELAADKTVILSTHILHEAAAVADRIVIVNRGRVAGQGTPAELRQQTMAAMDADIRGRARVALRTPAAVTAEEIGLALAECFDIRSIEPLPDSEAGEGVTAFQLRGPEERALLLAAEQTARARDWTLVELTPCPPTLEETFLRLTEPPSSAAPSAEETSLSA